jgi:tetratricopeptide (TPR) repeat protein
MLSIDHASRAAMAVAGGWLARAERLLVDRPEGIAHGYVALARGMTGLDVGELDVAKREFGRAHELATRFGDRDLGAMALVFEGTVLVASGEVSDGLALLDEATASALSGELQPLATGTVYCVTVHSCQTLGDCRRAAEWTDAANRWCDRLDLSGFPWRLSHPPRRDHASAGPVAAGGGAGAPGLRGAARLQPLRHGRRVLRDCRDPPCRGDFAAAEGAYRKANELGHDPQPGLALLRLAQGKVEAASTAIRRVLADEKLDPLSRARRLPAQVEIALAASEIRRAREAVQELERIADAFGIDGQRTPALAGAVELAQGQIWLAERDWEGAAAALRAARETWDRIGAPYETAQARMLLGLAYRGESDEDGAREELTAARATFERLGAVLDLQRAAELLGESTRRTSCSRTSSTRRSSWGRWARRSGASCSRGTTGGCASRSTRPAAR